MIKILRYLPLCALTLMACEKDIEIDLPEADPKLVIEGRIEQGQPAYVILTKSIGYFEPTDISTLEGLYVHDATVTVNDGQQDFVLTEFCLEDLSPEQRQLIETLTGLNLSGSTVANICLYVNFGLIGESGKIYRLNVQAEGNAYSATTRIPEPVALDSLWYEERSDNLGQVFAILSDPDTLGNAYRWYAQRINRDENGEPLDRSFVAPLGSAFDDQFINGLTFEFWYNRGEAEGDDELGFSEQGFFRTGDTVVVKFTTIDQDHYRFLRIFEAEQFNQGNPFGTPTTIPTNIDGGALGVWGGYGASIDTVVAIP